MGRVRREGDDRWMDGDAEIEREAATRDRTARTADLLRVSGKRNGAGYF